MFKDVFRGACGNDEKTIKKYQTLGFAVSSACAEIIADVFLCPWEAVSTLLSCFLITFQKIKQLYLIMKFFTNKYDVYSLKLKCKHQNQEPSPQAPSRELTISTQLKV
jgi:archaellum biogenesis protein FlaJ (TadC family)